MGVLFNMESVLLIEDAHAHDYEDFTDFLKKTKSNYSAVSIFLYFLKCTNKL